MGIDQWQDPDGDGVATGHQRSTGGGAVSSVATRTGDVVLTAADIGAGQLPSGVLLPSGVAIPSNASAATQTANDNSTKVATTGYVDTGLALKAPLSGAVLDMMHCNPNLVNAAAAGSNLNAAALTPTFYPIDPQGRSKFTIAALACQVTTLFAASTVGIGVYSIVYTSAATFTCTLVAALATAASSASVGVKSTSLSAPVAIDFTANSYVVGTMVSDVTTLKLANINIPTGFGAFKWNTTARSSTVDWPASFTQTSIAVSANSKGNWNALVSATGQLYI